jgi:hypothetical protein
MSEPEYPDISDILARKAEGRKKLAALSFAQKLEILEQMRARLAPFRKAREQRRLRAKPSDEPRR